PTGASRHFVEQPHTPGRDPRLGGEVFDQLDLLLGESSRLIADDSQHADQISLAHKGHAEPSSHADDVSHVGGFQLFILMVGQDIRTLNRATVDESALENRCSVAPLYV